MTDVKPPVEGKVWAQAGGGTAGAATSALILWIVGVSFFRVPWDAESATAAIAAVPWPISTFVGLVITIGGGFIAGYKAKHTPRPQVLTALAEVQNFEDVKMGLDPAFEGESLVEYEARHTNAQDKDGDGHDDATGQFLPRS